MSTDSDSLPPVQSNPVMWVGLLLFLAVVVPFMVAIAVLIGVDHLHTV